MESPPNAVNRPIFAVLVLVVLAALGWLVLSLSRDEDGGRAASPDASHEPFAAPRSALPLESPGALSDPGPVEPAQAPAEDRVAVPAPEFAAEAEGGTPEAWLSVNVSERTTGRPLRGIRVQVMPVGLAGPRLWDREKSWRRDLGHERETEAAGLVLLAVPPGIELELTARGGAGTERAALEVAALEAGEERELAVVLGVEPDLRFLGRTVERDTEAPVAGAVVRFVSSSRIEDWRALASRERLVAEAVSDEQGLFEARLPSWVRLHARVDAEGYGPTLFVPEVERDDPENARIVELVAAATLAGVVRGGWADGGGILEIRALTDGYRIHQAGTVFSFVGGDVDWAVEVAPGGDYELAGLPAEAPLAVSVRSGGEVVYRVPDPIRLEPGERRTLDLGVGDTAVLRGRLVDEQGRPVADQEMWLEPQSEARGSSMFRAYLDPLKRTGTDADGLFVFEGLAPGEWRVGPAPERHDWDEHDPELLAPHATAVAVPPGVPVVEVLVTAYRGLYIGGRVVGPDGGAIQGKAHVSGFCRETGVRSSTQSRAGGRFWLGPLVPGEYVLSGGPIGDSEGLTRSNTVTAVDGQDDVVLRLGRGGSIRGRVVDALSAEGLISEVHVSPVDPSLGWGLLSSTRSDGNFDFNGLPPGIYQAVARTADERIGLRTGFEIRAGEETAGVEVRVESGAAVELHHGGEEPYLTFRLRSDGRQVAFDTIEPGSTARKAVLPGAVTVEVRLEDGTWDEVDSFLLGVGEERRVEHGAGSE